MDSTGANQTPLTDDNTYGYEYPVWSGDGQRILFTAIDASAVTIDSIRADGSGRTVVVTGRLGGSSDCSRCARFDR